MDEHVVLWMDDAIARRGVGCSCWVRAAAAHGAAIARTHEESELTIDARTRIQTSCLTTAIHPSRNSW